MMNLILAEETAINITGKPVRPAGSKRVNAQPARGPKKSSFAEAMSNAESSNESSVQKKCSSTNAENLFSRQAADNESSCDGADSQFSNSSEMKERQLESGENANRKENLTVAGSEGNSSDSLAGKDMKQVSFTEVQSASGGSTHRIEKLHELSALIDRLSSLNDSKTNQWTVKVLNKMSGVNEITLIRSAIQGWTVDINLRAGALNAMQANDIQSLRANLQRRGHKVNEIAARNDDGEQTT